VTKLFKISASASKKWDQCRGQWTLRYHYKIPEIIANASALNFGSWIHDILEEAGKQDRYDVPFLKEVAMRTRNAYGTIERDKIALTATCLNNFSKWFGTLRASDCEIVGTEVGFDLDIDGNDHRAFGSIDLVMRHKPSGTLAVIDYKTSKKPSQVKYLRNDVQMLLYATVASIKWDTPIEKIRVSHYQPHLDVYTPLEYTEKQKQQFIKEWVRRMNLIREKGDTLDFTPNTLCDWCPYCTICPAIGGDLDVFQSIIGMGDKALEDGVNLKKFWLQARQDGIPV
jgi:RecB family exonuclease